MDTLEQSLRALEADAVHRYSGTTAPGSVRARAMRARRVRSATVAGVSATAVAAVALTGARVAHLWGPEPFVPASWAPAPSPLAADPQGNGHARVLLPSPPVPLLDEGAAYEACESAAPVPSNGTGHVTATIDELALATVTASGYSPTLTDAFEYFQDYGMVVRATLRTANGAAVAATVSDPLVVLVRDGSVEAVFQSPPLLLRDLEATSTSGTWAIETTRAVVQLDAETPEAQVEGFAAGGYPCMSDASRTIKQAAADTWFMLDGDYTAYWIARVVADDQAAAIADLQSDGVDVDAPPDGTGTPVRLYDGRTGSAVDVEFPASSQQDQFDEIVVSEPFPFTVDGPRPS